MLLLHFKNLPHIHTRVIKVRNSLYMKYINCVIATLFFLLLLHRIFVVVVIKALT